MRHTYKRIAGRELYVRVWGDKKASLTVFALHGVSRNGSDFEPLARKLNGRYRMICPDAVGRGLSQWAKDPEREYRIGPMVTQAIGLMQALKVRKCVWVGTSMGGLVGLGVAATPYGGRIKGLVLNDIAPIVPKESVGYIRKYLSERKAFDTLAQAEAYMRETYAQFGEMPGQAWRRLTVNSIARMPDGRWTCAYDPACANGLSEDYDEDAVWSMFARIRCPILVLRGEDSAILTKELAEKMVGTHHDCRLRTFRKCGHAPLLNTEQQIGAVERFIRKCAG